MAGSVCLVTAMECFLRDGIVGQSFLRQCGFLEGGWVQQGLSEAKEDFLRADRTGRSTPQWEQISLRRAELALVFLGCGVLAGGWRCWAAGF